MVLKNSLVATSSTTDENINNDNDNDNGNNNRQTTTEQQQKQQQQQQQQQQGEDNFGHLACFGIHPCLFIWLLFYISLIVYRIISSRNILLSILDLILSLIPVFLIMRYTIKYLKTDDLQVHKLMNVCLKSALPLSLLVIILELLITILLIFVIVGKKNLGELESALLGIVAEEKSSTSNNIGIEKQLELVKKFIPLWKAILVGLSSAIVVAALIEESSKWLLTYDSIQKYDRHNNRNIRSILTIAIFASLGFATIENISYTLQYTLKSSTSTSWVMQFLLIVLRDLLAFPVHIGCTMLIAFNWYFHKLSRGFFLAIFVHGWFDSVAFVSTTLQMYRIIDGFWVDITAVAVQVVTVIVFVGVLYVRFKPVVERYGILDGDGDSNQDYV